MGMTMQQGKAEKNVRVPFFSGLANKQTNDMRGPRDQEVSNILITI